MKKYGIYYEATAFVYAESEEEAIELAGELPRCDAWTQLRHSYSIDNIEVIDEVDADDDATNYF